MERMIANGCYSKVRACVRHASSRLPIYGCPRPEGVVDDMYVEVGAPLALQARRARMPGCTPMHSWRLRMLSVA